MTHFPRYLMHSSAVRITSRNQHTGEITNRTYRSIAWRVLASVLLGVVVALVGVVL